MKTQIHCKYCNKIIIEDSEEFFKSNKDKYIECPYCQGLSWVRDL